MREVGGRDAVVEDRTRQWCSSVGLGMMGECRSVVDMTSFSSKCGRCGESKQGRGWLRGSLGWSLEQEGAQFLA
jgi:hypothetical protein